MSTRGGGLLTTEKVYNFNQNLRTRKTEMQSALSVLYNALANRHHPSIKFTAEISDKEINFLDTTVYKGERFHNQGILDIWDLVYCG